MADIGVSSAMAICLNAVHSPALLAVSGAVLISLGGYIFYALYLHPLAKYPGPFLGRLTQWYDVYHAYRGDKHVLFYRLHQQYGSVVRFSPNTLSINNPAALKAIYAHGANVKKSIFYRMFRAAPNAVSTLLATEKPQHVRKRRVMSQAFSEHALRGLEHYVLGHVQGLIDKIDSVVKRPGSEKQRWSNGLDMAKYCNWLVFDIMGDLVFGKSFVTLDDHPENRKGIRLLGRAARRNYTVAAMPMLAQLHLERYLPLIRSLYLDRLKYLAFGRAQVQARMKESGGGETGRSDIFSFLLHAKDPQTGEGFPLPELWMEGNTLIVAGSDTSSTTMAAALYYLIHNPSTLHRLEDEIRGAFSRAEDIYMGSKLQHCSYLRACLDETMRMSPAVAGLLPREILEGGVDIPSMGLHLPTGVEVGVPIYAIHHNADYVAELFKFDPGLWLDQDDDKSPEYRQSKEALHVIFCPFSLGQRSCLGKPLVYMELSITIARLVWEYDMRLAPEQYRSKEIEREVRRGERNASEYQFQDWFLSNNESVMVEFRARDK